MEIMKNLVKAYMHLDFFLLEFQEMGFQFHPSSNDSFEVARTAILKAIMQQANMDVDDDDLFTFTKNVLDSDLVEEETIADVLMNHDKCLDEYV